VRGAAVLRSRGRLPWFGSSARRTARPAMTTDTLPAPTVATPVRRLGHLPGLDGLRGIAVVLVLLYHLEVAGFSGGFLGVDIFFVLSGFLITSLLLGELHSRRTISLANFWLRRARRLLPAVLVMIAVVVMLAPTIAATAQGGLRWDAVTSVGYVVNWRFVVTGASYAAESSDPSMLGHLWSLAIEEQFYVLWPLVVLIGGRSLQRRARPSTRAITLAVFASAIAASAGSLALAFDRFDPSGAYFATHTRVFEPLIGAALAVAVSPAQYSPAQYSPARYSRDRDGATGWHDSVTFLAGALVVTLAVVTLTFRDWRYYQGGALVVSLATAAMIAAIVRRTPIAALITDGRAVGVLGRVSYGLYLWHWPVIVWFDEERTGWSGAPLLLTRLALIAALTTASYVVIERPIRRGRVRDIDLTARIVFPAFAAAAALVVAVTFVATRDSEPLPDYLDEGGGVRQVAGNGELPALALVGDSVARSLAPGIEGQARATDRAYAQATFGGCSVGQLVRVDEHGDPFHSSQRCIEDTRTAFDALVSGPDPDVVIWYSQRERYGVEFGGEVLAAGSPAWRDAVFADWDATLDRLTAGGATVALVLPAYGDGTSTTACEDDGAEVILARDRCRSDTGALTGGSLRAFYREWAVDHEDRVVVIDSVPLVCGDTDPCASTIDGTPLRPDDGIHFSPQGARLVAPRLLDEIDRAVAKRASV
jgi:peptidoglycan/LPS O-acetylase OafA/YrhL